MRWIMNCLSGLTRGKRSLKDLTVHQELKDAERGILAGGAEYHADCEEVLLEDGSRQEDIFCGLF